MRELVVTFRWEERIRRREARKRSALRRLADPLFTGGALSLLLHGVFLSHWLQAEPVVLLPSAGAQVISVQLLAPSSPSLAAIAPQRAEKPVELAAKPATARRLAVERPLKGPAAQPRPPVKTAVVAPSAAVNAVEAAPSAPATGPAPAPEPLLMPARHDADYLNNPAPVYPPLSRRLGEQGVVLLRVQVSAEGRALAVDLHRSSGFARLDDTAREAVARWRFVPARRGEQSTVSWVVVPVRFSLQRAAG